MAHRNGAHEAPRAPDYGTTAHGLQHRRIALILDPDENRVRVLPEDQGRLTPELRLGLRRHHANFVRSRLYLRACAFVAARLDELGHREGTAAYRSAWEAFGDLDDELNDAWLDGTVDDLKDVLRRQCRAAHAAVPGTDPPPGAREPASQPALIDNQDHREQPAWAP